VRTYDVSRDDWGVFVEGYKPLYISHSLNLLTGFYDYPPSIHQNASYNHIIALNVESAGLGHRD
jgi:hypothetical protein